MVHKTAYIVVEVIEKGFGRDDDGQLVIEVVGVLQKIGPLL